MSEGLREADGAPADQEVMNALVVLVDRATAIVEQPCLEPGCDWKGQIQELEQARDVLLEISQ